MIKYHVCEYCGEDIRLNDTSYNDDGTWYHEECREDLEAEAGLETEGDDE